MKRKEVNYIELQLRNYQKDAVDFMISEKRVLLADEMGLGKTVTSLTAAQRLSDFPVLIIVPKIALYVWQEELIKWFDIPSTIYSGKPEQRKMKLAKFDDYNIPYLITNYAFTEEVLNMHRTWHTIICDEIHMAGLLNRKSKTFKLMKRLTRTCKNLFLVTGTPMRQGIEDLWSILHLLDRKRFSSFWRYAHTHGLVIQERFGKTIERRPKDVDAFKKMLDDYMVRRLKKDVIDELPDKIRQTISVQMVSEQKRMYNELMEEMITELDTGDWIVTPNVISRIVRLRQLLTTPRVFNSNINGGALDTLKKLVEQEFMQGNPVVVFTPYRQAVPYIDEQLKSIDAETFQVVGGMTARDVKNQVMDGFQKAGDKAALICVIKSGASFTAHRASVAFFVGAEWSVSQNLQAEDRLHRIGQTEVVRIKYLLYLNTIDDLVKERLNSKHLATETVLKPNDVVDTLK